MALTSVVIIDADPIYRAALRDTLAASGRFTVVGETDYGVTAIEIIRAVAPALVIVGTNLPDLSSLQLARLIAMHRLVVPVVVLGDPAADQQVAGHSAIAALVPRTSDDDSLLCVLDRLVGNRPPARALPGARRGDGSQTGPLLVINATVRTGIARGLTLSRHAFTLTTPALAVTG